MTINCVRSRAVILMMTLLCIYLLSNHNTSAQEINRKFNHITVDDGLSQNSGWFSYQDSRGYMWFGTYAGLNRFDGTNMKIYVPDPNDSTSISDLWAESCIEDAAGNIWIGTTHGLNKYDHKTDRFTRYLNSDKLNSLQNNDINDLLITRKGELWIATSNGLAHYNYISDDFEHYLYQDSLSGENFITDKNIISSMAEDDDGNLILANGVGSIIVFNTETYETQEIKYIDSKVKTADWAKIVLDSTNVLWISSYDNGLFSMNYLTKEVTDYSVPGNKFFLNDLVTRSLLIDSNFNLWVGSDGDGLFIINPERTSFQNYKANPTVPTALSTNRGIFDIYEDRNGIVWLSQYISGIAYFDPNEKDFNTIRNDPTNPKSLGLNAILAFYMDPEGIIWIGIDGGGIDEYNPLTNEFKHNRHSASNKNSLQSNVIKCIAEDQKGNLFLGTWNSGLLVFNKSNKTSKQYVHHADDPSSLIQKDIWAIEVDKQDRVWLGTLKGGLDQFIPENGAFIHYGPLSDSPNKTNDSDIRVMYQDPEGIIWIGTVNGGVNKLNPETEKIEYFVNNPSDENSLAKNDVRAILKDEDGMMWFGTNGAGLDKFDEAKNKFTHYTMEDGLPSNIIQGVLQDDEGFLWIATGKGLSTLDTESNEFRSYFKNDGLQGDDFQYGASMKAKDGTLYFGGVDGFNAFHPSKIKDDLMVPNVVFTKLTILYNEVSHKSKNSVLKYPIEETESITLNYDQTEFSIEFAALNYTNPEKNQFIYKMEGFDKDWIFIGNKKIASYTNLDPGEYNFRIKASINDGIWSEEGASLIIHILPPWWFTWWAYLIWVMLTIFLIAFFYRMRVGSLKSQRKKLQMQVAERTNELEQSNVQLRQLDEYKESMTAMIVHDFKNSLNTVISFSEGTPTERRLKSIRQAGQFMLNMVLNILDVQKFEAAEVKLSLANYHIGKVLNDAVQQLSYMLEQKSIKLSYVQNDLHCRVDYELVTRVVINILSNAIKYVDTNGAIEITTGRQDDLLVITIKDNGQGIPADKVHMVFDKYAQINAKKSGSIRSTGLGLAFCKMVVEAHGGTIGVESIEGEGSEFYFTVPRIGDIEKLAAPFEKIDRERESALVFSEMEMAQLKPALEALKQWEVYDYSEVKTIVDDIVYDDGNITSWKERLQKAIHNGNEKAYNELINL